MVSTSLTRTSAPLERHKNTYFQEVVIQTQRVLRGWFRDPLVLGQSILLPAVLLLVYHWVFGKTTDMMFNNAGLNSTVPMVAVMAAIFSSLGTSLSLIRERQTGVLKKMYLASNYSSAPFVSRIIAEFIRGFACTILVFIFGLCLGLKLPHNFFSNLALLFLPMVPGMAFVALLITLAVQASGRNIIDALNFICLVGLFFNSGVAPKSYFPHWLQKIVEYQPFSPPIRAMSNLLNGDSPWKNLAITMGTSAFFLAIFGYTAVVNYTKACQK